MNLLVDNLIAVHLIVVHLIVVHLIVEKLIVVKLMDVNMKFVVTGRGFHLWLTLWSWLFQSLSSLYSGSLSP